MIGLLNGYRPLLAEEQNEAQRPLNLARAPHALYALLDNADAELEDTPAALLSHIERSLAKKAPPQLFLKISFFSSRTPKADEEAQSTLRVALSALNTAQRSLYARADDAPCLRGGRLPANDPDVRQKYLGDLSGPWSMRAMGNPLGVVERSEVAETMHVLTADAGAVSRWNARMERKLVAPWKPLSDVPLQHAALPPPLQQPLFESNHLASGSSALWPSKANREMAIETMTQYLRDDNSASRYLVCPETPFGWDLMVLQDAISSKLESDAGISTILASFGINERFRSARVHLEVPRPATTFRILTQSWHRALYSRGVRLYKVAFVLISAVAILLEFSVALVLFVAEPSSGVHFTTGGLVFLLLALLQSLFLFACLPLCEDQGTIHEGIGVAWNLSGWTSTQLRDTGSGGGGDIIGEGPPQYLTKADVLANAPGALDARLQGDTWYVRYGLSEREWWAQNATTILKALRSGRKNTLFLDEHTLEQRPVPTTAPVDRILPQDTKTAFNSSTVDDGGQNMGPSSSGAPPEYDEDDLLYEGPRSEQAPLLTRSSRS